MKFYKQSVFQLASSLGISDKHTKLLLLCFFLVVIKFLLLPILEWQEELKEQADFYKLQYREKESITLAQETFIAENERLTQYISELKAHYYKGEPTRNQVLLNEAISQKANQLGLSITSSNVVELYNQDGTALLEYGLKLHGTAMPLQEFVYWLELQEPKLLVKLARFSSHNRSVRTDLVLTVHQYILTEEENG